MSKVKVIGGIPSKSPNENPFYKLPFRPDIFLR